MHKQSWWNGANGEWYVVIQLVLFGLIAFAPAALPGWPAWTGSWRTASVVVGLGFGALGGLLAIAGVVSLGENLTAVPRPKDNAQLVVHGAYRWVRHPIYSGLILGALGLGLLRGGWLSLLYALLLFIFFDIKSRREEDWLREKYDGYSAYQRRVRKLIPFLY